MTPRFLDADMATSAQIGPGDLSRIAAAGFATVVCNRPDGEEEGQPAAAALASAARAAGLGFVHIPIAGSTVGPEQIAALRQVLETSSGPVFGFCRSGMRTTVLWALARANAQEPEALVAAAREAGYDLSPLRPRLDAQAAD